MCAYAVSESPHRGDAELADRQKGKREEEDVEGRRITG